MGGEELPELGGSEVRPVMAAIGDRDHGVDAGAIHEARRWLCCSTAQLATISATPSSIATRRSTSAARFVPQERNVVFASLVGGLADHRGVGGLDHRDE
jgi:hypothetical protein